MIDHKEIWLSPWCIECNKGCPEERTWCQDSVVYDPCEECGNKPIRYVRADCFEELERIKENYRRGLNEIVQMERYPRESGSDVYDGIYPTGAFAVQVLKGEWPK